MAWACVGLALCDDCGPGAVLAVHALDSSAYACVVCAFGLGFDVEVCGAFVGDK